MEMLVSDVKLNSQFVVEGILRFLENLYFDLSDAAQVAERLDVQTAMLEQMKNELLLPLEERQLGSTDENLQLSIDMFADMVAQSRENKDSAGRLLIWIREQHQAL